MKHKRSLQEIIRTYDPSNTDYIAIVYAGIEGNPSAIAGITSGQNATSSEIASKWQWRLFGGAIGAGVAGGAGAVARLAFAIITVHEQHLCFYILNKWSMSLLVEQKVMFPYNDIIKLKISKFLIWTKLKIIFLNRSKKYKLNINISSKVVVMEGQKQNIDNLVEYLNKIFA